MSKPTISTMTKESANCDHRWSKDQTDPANVFYICSQCDSKVEVWA